MSPIAIPGLTSPPCSTALFGRSASGRFTLSLYFSVALALISAFWLLWQSSERQLHRALVAESRNLAEIADQHIARGDAATAILLALEALPDTDAVEARKRRRPYVAAAERAL